MDRVGIAPKIATLETPPTDNWFRIATQRFNIYSGAANPTVAEVPENQWIVYYNTTVPEVRIWTNIAGTLKKSAAFT